MKQYWIKGIFVTAKGLRNKRKDGQYPPNTIEPFMKSFWASSPKEAVQEATLSLEGGAWLDGPQIVRTSEEERLRKIGAPELPGMAPPKKKGKKK